MVWLGVGYLVSAWPGFCFMDLCQSCPARQIPPFLVSCQFPGLPGETQSVDPVDMVIQPDFVYNTLRELFDYL